MLDNSRKSRQTAGWGWIGVLLYAAIQLFDIVDPINYRMEIDREILLP